MKIKFSEKSVMLLYVLKSEDNFHSILAQSCTFNSNCLSSQQICSRGVCQPNTCIYNGQCAYGSTCISSRCQGNMFRYIFSSLHFKQCSTHYPLPCAHVRHVATLPREGFLWVFIEFLSWCLLFWIFPILNSTN